MVHISINDFLMLQQSDIDPTTKVQSIRRIYRGVNSVIHITQIYLLCYLYSLCSTMADVY